MFYFQEYDQMKQKFVTKCLLINRNQALRETIQRNINLICIEEKITEN